MLKSEFHYDLPETLIAQSPLPERSSSRLLRLDGATGALIGGLVAFLLPERVLAALFAGLLAYTAVVMARRSPPAAPLDSDGGVESGASEAQAAVEAGPDLGPGARLGRRAAAPTAARGPCSRASSRWPRAARPAVSI